MFTSLQMQAIAAIIIASLALGYFTYLIGKRYEKMKAKKTDNKSLPAEPKKDYRIWILIGLVLVFGGYFVMDNVANKAQQEEEQILSQVCGPANTFQGMACRKQIRDAENRKK